ncbi:hydrogenase nickel incorporation protein HypB [Flagellimonas nanhaiensis]|uniref:Hydrogenase accessory protein HypB n=1 Tax=Flagellimonas nanhaiensis TaxID=2292706 RepID=A0A371JTL1_9FLAO|nr:hydrogenase nickel incorporation protein HypB [Allomuricauda nanhaiensis]RDY61116.1 hydrogenase accessory protein HypB [Allomuricauda nanhaiensis]
MIEKSTKAARGTVQCENTNINLLKANDFVADIIKKEMARTKTLLVNITSSAGSGKTTLMQKTAEKLKNKIKIAVMVGDLETERDAERIRQTGIQALQIVTGGICHLEAQMIHQVLDQFDLEKIDLLFIENVGNLVCPSSFDLGEDYRVTLMATTEGDDKPKKYPKMFLTSDMMLVSKADLLPYVPFSVEAVTKDAREVNHELEVIQISSITEEGIDEWCDWLLKKVLDKKG